MKRLALAMAAMCAFGPFAHADLTSYNKPPTMTAPKFRLYRQVLPQAVPTALTAVVTQVSGCSSAAGGAAPVMTYGCGVYIDQIIIACPAASAGTVLVQDQQSTPIPLMPTVTAAATTLYVNTFQWAWAPGGFKIQQVSGTGCTFQASWGTP